MQEINSAPTVAQVDIVPTLSLLLGLPIPFSNLGKVVTPLFTLNFKDTCFDEETGAAIASAISSSENAMQIQRYLHAYRQMSNELTDIFVTKMKNQLKDLSQFWSKITNNITESKNILFSISEGYKSYMENVRNTCSQKWAMFNLQYIVLGIFVLCFTVFWNLWMSEKFSHMESIFIFIFILLLCCIGLLYMFNLLNFFTLCVLGIVALISFLFRYRCVTEEPSFRYLIHVVFGVMFVLTAVSIYIDVDYLNIIGCFLVIFMYCLILLFLKMIPQEFHELMKNIRKIPIVIVLILFLISFSNSFIVNEDHIMLFLLQSIIVYRFSPTFTNCIKLYICGNSSSKIKTTKKNVKGFFRYLIQPFCLMCLIICIRMGSLFYKCREEQSSCENSDIILSLEKLHQDQSHKLFRLVMSLASEIIPFILFLGVMCYKYCAKSQTVSAVCVKYGTFFVCVLTSLRWWLNIVSPEIVNRILKGNEVVLTRAALLTSTIMFLIILIYPILTEKPWEVPSKEIYCGSFTSLLFIVLQILYLVAGDALSPAVMLMNFSIILFAVLIQFSFDGSESEIWTDTIILSLLSRHWFYATAHQPTFTSIQWDAAFLLNHKEIHSYTLSGALVVINTFSAFIFHGLAVPGILIVRDSFYVTTHSMARLHMKYLLCFGIKLLGTVIASFVLRRHLMVWKIFSPKLIYEVIGVIVTMFSVSFSHYFIIKVTSLYHKLIRMNLNQMFTSKDQ
ncbi:UNVERIFIED_CONTAM: GPI ethanolamine phosphate transferase 3 [Trichonephila clavipes]